MIFHCSFFKRHSGKFLRTSPPSFGSSWRFFGSAKLRSSSEVACHWAPNTPSTRISQRFLPLHSTFSPNKKPGGMVGDAGHGMTGLWGWGTSLILRIFTGIFWSCHNFCHMDLRSLLLDHSLSPTDHPRNCFFFSAQVKRSCFHG